MVYCLIASFSFILQAFEFYTWYILISGILFSNSFCSFDLGLDFGTSVNSSFVLSFISSFHWLVKLTVVGRRGAVRMLRKVISKRARRLGGRAAERGLVVQNLWEHAVGVFDAS